MIVSHRHRFIFLKTMKTASSSMEIALSEMLGPDDIITPARPDLDEKRTSGVGGQNYRLVDHPDVPKRKLWRRLLQRPERYYHPTVGYFEHMPGWRVRKYLGEEIWNSYYKFAFERNPWDRQVSFYNYKTRDKKTPETFDQFLAKGERAKVDNWGIYTLDGEVAVDFVGRYENVAEDFNTAMVAIGLGDDIVLPRANMAKKSLAKRSYRNFYTDETRELMGKWYPGEIALMDYSF